MNKSIQQRLDEERAKSPINKISVKTLNNKLAKMGENNPNYGKPGTRLGIKLTPEQVENNRRAQLGKTMSPASIEKTRLANLGSKRSEEAKENMRQAQAAFSPKKVKAMHAKTAAKNTGKKRTEEQKANMRGKVRTPEMIAAMAARRTGQIMTASQKKASMRTCPHCGLVGRGGTMTRYHFDNCKQI